MADAGLVDAVLSCPTCSKPFRASMTSQTPDSVYGIADHWHAASSYNRHLSYCRRAQLRPKARRTSCGACKAAKVKCSFQPQCTRCASRGLDCVYERKSLVEHEETARNYAVSLDSTMTPWSDQSSFAPADSQVMESFDLDFADVRVMQEHTSTIAKNSALNSGELVPASRRTDATTHFGSVSMLSAAWNFSFDFLSENSPIHTGHHEDSGYLSRITPPKAYAQHSADLIVEALYAIPNQMLRRETFPPFIYPHWSQPALPESLAVCMHLAGIYSSRTPELRAFLWRTILTEQRRAAERIDTLSNQEILAQVQAGIVYLTMRLVDEAMHDLEWTREMLTIQNILCTRFLENNEFCFCHSEETHPSPTWEDWIYAESRRRTSLIWFLITRTIVIMPKTECHTTISPETLPLPAPQMQWEARTREAWLKELGAEDSAMTTFGSLVNVKQHIHEQESKQKLGVWSARMDRLGSLLNIAVALV